MKTDIQLKTHEKIKTGVKKILVRIAIAAGVLFLCFFIYYMIDFGLNGMILEYLETHFMFTYQEYLPDVDNIVYVHQPDWHLIKRTLIILFTAAVLLWLVALQISTAIYGRWIRRKNIRIFQKMVRESLSRENDPVLSFPDGYGDIAAQLSQIRERMEHHEQVLKEEAARKNDLITYLAHDLKTPLTSVIGYLCLLSEAPDMPAPQRIKYVDITLEKARRLETLINEFFDITRFNLQQITVNKKPIDLSYMLIQMSDEFYPLLQEHKNTITLDTPEDIFIEGDPTLLARVFNNILKNAIAYSYPATPIAIQVIQDTKEIRIYFKNRGKTIPPQKLESIFEKFFRMDEARSSNTGGAGLGLAIARDIVALHGGTISAQSQNDEILFCVALPLSPSVPLPHSGGQ